MDAGLGPEPVNLAGGEGAVIVDVAAAGAEGAAQAVDPQVQVAGREPHHRVGVPNFVRRDPQMVVFLRRGQRGAIPVVDGAPSGLQQPALGPLAPGLRGELPPPNQLQVARSPQDAKHPREHRHLQGGDAGDRFGH